MQNGDRIHCSGENSNEITVALQWLEFENLATTNWSLEAPVNAFNTRNTCILYYASAFGVK